MREKQRITIPGAIKLIEEQTNGVITKEDWFSVPYVGGINKFIEALTGEYKYDLSIHFACGAGSYIFLDTDNKIIPLTRFVDAAGLFEHLQNAVNEMEGKSKMREKAHSGQGAAGHKQVHRQGEAAEVRQLREAAHVGLPEARLRERWARSR